MLVLIYLIGIIPALGTAAFAAQLYAYNMIAPAVVLTIISAIFFAFVILIPKLSR